MRIERLYRYPVKGLTAEALDGADLLPGAALPWDRAFALAHGDAPFDPDAPRFLPKSNFMCLLRHAGIAGLRAAFDPHGPALSIQAPDGSGVVADPLDPAGRERIGAYLATQRAEIDQVRAAGTEVELIVPDLEFLTISGFGMSLMDFTVLGAAAEAGARLGKLEAERIGDRW